MDITVPLVGQVVDARRLRPQVDPLEVTVLALDAGSTEARLRTGCAEFGPRSEWLLAIVEHATTLLMLARGDYEGALAERGHGPRPILSVTYPNVVEAATRCGRHRIAANATDGLAARVALSSVTGMGLLARCQALTDDGASAESSYREAIARLDHCALELARTRLVYGEWLRRMKRRADAREQLRAAEHVFVTMGARTLAARARAELAATGESARRRAVDTINNLTPQEAHVARLAASGWTNGEIAAALFLSPSTVDYHLRKVFRKLAVSSRRKLSLVMPNAEPTTVASTPAEFCSA